MSNRPSPSRRAFRVVLGSLLVLAVAACSAAPGATPAPSTTGSPAPSGAPPSPTPAGSPPIAHPTGAREVVLRFEEGGGFVMPSFAATQLPYFTLYGDGTVIYRPAASAPEEQKPGEPLRFPPVLVARMTEDQVQALLKAGLADGGLATARARYDFDGIADAPTALFTIHANGLDKTVSVYALGIDGGTGPDAAIRTAMGAFAERLRAFDAEVGAGRATAVGVYAPDRFRGLLLQREGGATVPRSWPWPTFGPDAFVALPGGPFGSFPSRALSGLEVSLLGVDRIAGGVSGIMLVGPDGRTQYDLSLRPLLPDEVR